MAHEIFISYAAEDKPIADAVCQAIESQQIKCWYAPRDVEYGKDFEESIVDAIVASRLVILILTSHANDSAHVKREIQNACMEGVNVPVLPFRTEDVPLNKALRYYIGSVHWLDAVTTPLEPHLQRLVEHVRVRLSPAGASSSSPQTPVQDEPAPAIKPLVTEPSANPNEVEKKQIALSKPEKKDQGEVTKTEGHGLAEPWISPVAGKRAWPAWALPGALIALLVVGAVTGWYLYPRRRADRVDSAKLNEFSYRVVELDKNGTVVSQWTGAREFFVEDLDDDVKLEMVPLPGGKFLMGSTDAESKNVEEHPQHEVTVRPFSIGKNEITQAQWRAVAKLPKVKMDLNPDLSRFKGDNLPVDSVGWNAAMEFCARLSIKTGRSYRLPSEAEWEYACRAGTAMPFGHGQSIIMEFVNFRGSNYGNPSLGRGTSVAVGSLGVANSFGLFDMHGNMIEWCLDPPHDSYVGAPIDGSAWNGPRGLEADSHILRGGGYGSPADNCRCAWRRAICDNCISGWVGDYTGFRVVTVAR